MQCNLEQLLGDGFFHADPHAGNLLRTADGRLAYLDFGMMVVVTEERRSALVVALVHLITRDFLLLAQDLGTLEFLPPDFCDYASVATALEAAFCPAEGGEEGGKGDELSHLDFSAVTSKLAVCLCVCVCDTHTQTFRERERERER